VPKKEKVEKDEKDCFSFIFGVFEVFFVTIVGSRWQYSGTNRYFCSETVQRFDTFALF
jgi:hypothetical protein